MTTTHSRVLPDGDRPTRARSVLEKSLARYPRRHRPRLARLAAVHPRLADLASTFPGLLFGLSMPGRRGDTERAIRLAVEGRRLRSVAEAAAIPMWLRRLPPEAFDDPLDGLPGDAAFGARIVNALPQSRKYAATWLRAVCETARWSDPDVAIWLARELRTRHRPIRPRGLKLVWLHAWYSRSPELRAAAGIGEPWHDRMALARARRAAEAWRNSIEMRLLTGDRPIDTWVEAGSVLDFDFVPVYAPAALEEEGEAMRNCAATYGHAIARNQERLWSIRHNRRRVATLSIGYSRWRPIVDIVDLRGRANGEAPRDVWLAARRWLDAQNVLDIQIPDVECRSESMALDRGFWRIFWRPYWLDKKAIPDWLPLAPSWAALDAL